MLKLSDHLKRELEQREAKRANRDWQKRQQATGTRLRAANHRVGAPKTVMPRWKPA